MRIVIRILGALLLLLGAYQTLLYIRDYDVITQYGKGYVWGSVIMTLAGGALVIMSFRKKRR